MLNCVSPNLITKSAIKRAIQQSYSGVYVDEYQDCSVYQHEMIVALADILPCRILGDPLQGVFDFKGQAIDWDTHIPSNFELLPEMQTPWRWIDGNVELGNWLLELREMLLTDGYINLEGSPVHWRLDDYKEYVNYCRLLANKYPDSSILGINQWGHHKLARSLRGLYCSIEPLAASELLEAASIIESSTGAQRAIAMIDFADKCVTDIKKELKLIRTKFSNEVEPDFSKIKKHGNIVRALLKVANSSDISFVAEAFKEIGQVGSVFRRELWYEMQRALRAHRSGHFESLTETTKHIRTQTRNLGRKNEPRIISKTLLIKGLEFDYTIVFRADQLDKRHLYVAMTRAKKALVGPYASST